MEQLFEVAEQVGVEVMSTSLPESMTGIFIRSNEIEPVACLSHSIQGQLKMERVTLATCIGSHIVLTDDTAYAPCYYDDYKKRLTASRQEYKRMRKAAEILIDTNDLLDAITSGLEEVWELAEHFNVTEDFIALRLAVWEKSGR